MNYNNNNKVKYIKPNLDIMDFHYTDIIQTSESPFGPTPDPPLYSDEGLSGGDTDSLGAF